LAAKNQHLSLLIMNIRKLNLIAECKIKATRSGGAGGQHVNKVSSRIELSFDIANSSLLTEDQKTVLLLKLKTKVTDEGVLRVTEDSDRSQHANREKAAEKFYKLLEKAFFVPKKRVKTKIPKGVIEKRIENKKKKSVTKKLRGKGIDF
jgi:ribosome-associated protein